MGRKTIALLGTAAVFRIALFVVVVTVLVFVPSALAGKPGGGTTGGGGPNGGSGTIALTLLNSTDGLPHFGQEVTFAVTATSTTQPWVRLKCFQNGTLVYEQANGIFANSLDQNFTLGPTPSWTGGAVDCTAYLQDWTGYSKGKIATLATMTFHVFA